MKELIKLPLTLLIVAVICTAMITITYQLTAPILASREEESLTDIFENQLYVGDVKFESYEVLAENPQPDCQAVYKITLSDGSVETAYNMVEAGKNGNLKIIVTYNSDNVVTNLAYLQFNETPGIGSKVQDASYVDNIIGQSASNPEVDTISGATLSSTAVKNAVVNSSELQEGGTYNE